MKKQQYINYLNSMSIKRLEFIYKKVTGGRIKLRKDGNIDLLDIEHILEKKTRQQNRKSFDPIRDFKIDYIYDWLDTFPEAKQIVKQKIKEYQKMLEELEQQRDNLYIKGLEQKEYSPGFFRVKITQEKLVQKIRKCKKIINYLRGQLPIRKNQSKNRVTLQEIDQANSIPLEQLTTNPKKVSQNRIVAICPFHEDTKPSLSITIDKNLYYCFVCGAGGTPITYIMKTQHFNFIDSVRKLCHYL